MALTLRAEQAELVEYYLAHRGRLGVSAVPGSGKTHTLSYLAARLVIEALDDDQEVLIVTLVNSAVDNFRARIAAILQEMGFLPGMGYRVRTLHGLAHDIVRQRPGLVGLAEDFVIVDERESDRLLREAALSWLQEHPHIGDAYFDFSKVTERKEARIRNNEWRDTAIEVIRVCVRRAKDWRLSPEELAERLARVSGSYLLADMVAASYTAYQVALAARGGVDFEDLIRLAYRILEIDADFLTRLRRQWPFILEDEAQDSSQSQEDMLRLLTDHPEGNWVRVGDPNQAVYHTFTNASPEYLRRFLIEPGVTSRELPCSGRSQPAIIRLANRLIDWTREEHPVAELRDALSLPHIEPVPPGDPQPNPAEDAAQVQLIATAYSPAQELHDVVRSVQHWLTTHPDETVAVLAPTNRRGAELADALRAKGVPTVELLETTPATRSAAEVIATILYHLSQPTSAQRLAELWRAWQRRHWQEPEQHHRLRVLHGWLHRLRHTETFLWPEASSTGLEEVPPEVQEDPVALEMLTRFRDQVRLWQAAVALPIDQLLLTLAQDVFSEPTDLALAHKLAVELRHQQDLNPDWRLPDLVDELAVIARNERRFLGFSETAYQAQPGEVTVATMHKAKGLEWDRVYLTSVNTYDFPSGQPGDTYIAEKWFIRDNLNLEAEALAQLRAVASESAEAYIEGQATQQARLDYCAERLRLLYVGITRARKELVITWNTGKAVSDQPPRQAALPFTALIAFRERAG